MTTGAAATSRSARRYTAAATRKNTTPTKNTRRPSRSRSRHAPTMARRVLGETHEITLKMRKVYAGALWQDDTITLDDLRESVTMLEDLERTARRVYGNSHPTTIGIGEYLETSQAVLRARYKSRYWDILACSFAVALFAWVWWYSPNDSE